jgi:hypothetical protein
MLTPMMLPTMSAIAAVKPNCALPPDGSRAGPEASWEI